MKWTRAIRYWLIRCLVGKMSVVANVEISNWDFFSNKERCEHNGSGFMFYGNHIYLLEKRIHERVYTGNTGKVSRRGNVFVLEEI